jgi:uncharacterized protein (DUF2141 family)
MKKNQYLFVIIILLGLSTSLINAQSSFIKVKVLGIEEIEGEISIGLFNDPDGFPKKRDNNLGVSVNVDSSSVEYTFIDLKNGEYAIAIYHDENSNGELDRSFFGMPTEDYVFSNYATGSFGPPSFEDSKFNLIDSLTIELDLQK